MMYVICWQNGDEIQRGKPITKELAESWLVHLRKAWPALHHWIEPVAVDAEQESRG